MLKIALKNFEIIFNTIFVKKIKSIKVKEKYINEIVAPSIYNIIFFCLLGRITGLINKCYYLPLPVPKCVSLAKTPIKPAIIPITNT